MKLPSIHLLLYPQIFVALGLHQRSFFSPHWMTVITNTHTHIDTQNIPTHRVKMKVSAVSHRLRYREVNQTTLCGRFSFCSDKQKRLCGYMLPNGSMEWGDRKCDTPSYLHHVEKPSGTEPTVTTLLWC